MWMHLYISAWLLILLVNICKICNFWQLNYNQNIFFSLFCVIEVFYFSFVAVIYLLSQVALFYWNMLINILKLLLYNLFRLSLGKLCFIWQKCVLLQKGLQIFNTVKGSAIPNIIWIYGHYVIRISAARGKDIIYIMEKS